LKLKVGDIIEVHGFVMLKGLDGGNKYKVAKISEKNRRHVYWFSKARGKKIVIGHYTSDVDMLVHDNSDYNFIRIMG
jgi:myosin heavy subunit